MNGTSKLTATVAAALGLWLAGTARAQESDLLPGELPVKPGREMPGGGRLPTIREVIAASRDPQPRVLTAFRLHGDSNNHYAPSWSRDGRRLSFLRNDLALRTCKILLLNELRQRTPQTLYDSDLSFDHMNRWSEGESRYLAFASNNAADRAEGIHWANTSESPPRFAPLVQGKGVAAFPSLHVGAGRGHLVYRRDDELHSLRFSLADPSRPETVRLGRGYEAVLSPDAASMAVVRGSGDGGGQQLLLQDVATGTDRLLHDGPKRILRNPTWSPDRAWLAFYAQVRGERSWELWVAATKGEPAARKLASDVRVEEGFLHVSPAWSADAARLWFVSTQGENGYHPLLWLGVREGQGKADYPRLMTTATNVAVCPDPGRPLIAFVAAGDPAIDLYLMLMSHL